jgi:1,4-alpha-glucan branching enzyme
MGCELGAFREWDHKGEIEWFLLDYDMHSKYQRYISELNAFYPSSPELYECDGSWAGFNWIDADDAERSVFCYKRIDSSGNELVVILNFTPIERSDYMLSARSGARYAEVFNSDKIRYGGEGRGNQGELRSNLYDGTSASVKLCLPPLSAIILKEIKDEK